MIKKTVIAILAIFMLAGISLATSTQFNVVTQVKGILPLANGGTNNSTGQGTTTFLQQQISSNVTLGTNSFTSSAGTFPNVVTATAGTWWVEASVDLQTTSVTATESFTCELFDGTTAFASGFSVIPATTAAAVKNVQISLVGTRAEVGAVTFSVRCTSGVASQLMAAAATANSAGNNASTISAFRLQ